MVAIGARMNTVEEAREICEVFLTTHFSDAERHARRLAMVERYELHGRAAPDPRQRGLIAPHPGPA